MSQDTHSELSLELYIPLRQVASFNPLDVAKLLVKEEIVNF